jgi:hypothetical protein
MGALMPYGNAWTFERLARRFEEGPLDRAAPDNGAGAEHQTKHNNKEN